MTVVMMILNVNCTQSRVTWEERLIDGLSRSSWHVGMPEEGCLDYINLYRETQSKNERYHSLGLGLSSGHTCKHSCSALDCRCDVTSYFKFLLP